jgi:flagellar protein FliS
MAAPGTVAALSQYRSAYAQATAEVSPHRQIAMLLDGAVDRLNMARGCMLGGDLPRKLALMSSAMAIVDYLRLCLDLPRGGEIAANLAALYQYMSNRLLKANLDNDAEAVGEVVGLLNQIRSGWEGIAGV